MQDFAHQTALPDSDIRTGAVRTESNPSRVVSSLLRYNHIPPLTNQGIRNPAWGFLMPDSRFASLYSASGCVVMNLPARAGSM